MSRVRYQSGSLSLVGDVWKLRYYESHMDGARTRRAVIVGTKDQFPTKRLAMRAADAIMREVNDACQVVRFEHLCESYLKKGMSHIREYSQLPYRCHVAALRSQFGSMRLDELATPKGIAQVEEWLNSARTRKDGLMSAATRKGRRTILALMIRYAMKCGYLAIQRNPIDLVDLRNTIHNTAPKRKRVVVTVDQYHALLRDETLPQVCKVLLQLCTMTGLRSCEAIGLKWEDIEFGAGKIRVRRSVKGRYHDRPKTAESEATVPMHEDLAAVLREWKKFTVVIEDWVFGSTKTNRPLLATSLQKEHLRAAGERVGIEHLGWHNFRHTYRSLGRASGASLEEQRILMRHANISMTATYGNDGIDRADAVREPNSKIVTMLRTGTEGR